MNHPRHAKDSAIKHYGEFPGAIFLDPAPDDNGLVYIANYPTLGGAPACNEIVAKSAQDQAYKDRFNTLFQGVQPTVPAGYVPSAQVSAACAKYAEFLAQKHH